MRARYLLITVAVAALSAGWYWFRPERALLDRVVNEAVPAGLNVSAATLRRGEFRSLAHTTSGTALVLAGSGGGHVLRLADFTTSDGPDVRVYLVGAGDIRSNAELERAGYLDLGALKGNRGAQNYLIPAETDVSRYAAVAIWCRRFGVNFATADLVGAAPPALAAPGT